MADNLPKGAQEALIMIPDISGFTRFIAEVDIEHSQHIVAELLETIIDANQLEMEVSEVEGDAVLFYRFGKRPTQEEIEQQAEKMYLDFHTALLAYENRRVCNCGACSTAINLGLKVIAHAGQVSKVKIKQHVKLMGSDVILAHRLLKNDVPGDEYLLLSESTTDKAEQPIAEWVMGKSTYDGLGDVDYIYKMMEPLRQKISLEDPLKDFQLSENPVTVKAQLSIPVEEGALLISDISLRPSWITGIDRVDLNEDHLHRVGDSHQCVVGNREMNVATVDVKWKEEDFQLVETNFDTPFFGQVSTVFKLSPDATDPKLSQVGLEVHPQGLGFFKKMIWSLVARKVVSKQMTRALEKLNQLSLKASMV